MESDLHPQQQQQQQQQQPMSSGLMRYQSAPSSYFTNLINSGGAVYGGDQFLNPLPPTPENEQIFAKYMPSGADPLGNETVQSQFVGTMKHEEDNYEEEMIYQSQTQVDDNLVSSMGMDRLRQMKMGGGNNSNLIRHRSSPAGLFSDINIQNAGYAAMRGTGDFGAGGGTNAEASFSSASRLKGQMDYPTSSWDDSAILPDNFLSGLGDNDRTTFSNLNSSENQNGEGGSRTPNVLAHHLSLPTSSAEFSAMEKLLQFQDSVPLKIRAKRGCATHPRSIAERVRRTRISERMRKLQDLVPNMDKQTNTSDMLDLAVDYIKDLQKQVKKLSDNRAKCTCSK